MDLDLKELKRMLREELSKKVDASEAIHVIMSPQMSYNEDYEAGEMEAEAESLREQLREGDYTEISLPVRLFLKAKGISIGEDSLIFKRLCHQALIDSIDFYEIEAKRARGDCAFERHLLLPDKIDSVPLKDNLQRLRKSS